MGARLVGRDSELTTLERALAEAGQGRGRIMLLSGEAGIGKSRLAGELLSGAAGRGVITMEGRAHPLHAGLAYAPIVEAIRAYLSTLDDAVSAKLLGGLTDLGRLLADPRLGDAPPLGDAGLERTRMFDAVTRLFARIATSSPVLLVVEDLHWADRGTVELVHYVGHSAVQQRLLVLASYRAGKADGPLRDLAVAVRRGDPDDEIALAPLADGAVAELTKSLLGGEPPEDLLHTVTSRAKGIPLFVTALVHGPDAPDVKLLPAIVRDLVLDRLHRLDDAERRLVEIVAVAGESGTAEILRAVFDAADFEPTLRRLVADGLVTEQIAGRSETYRVTHPLYAEVAYAELTIGERRALHAAFAAAIDAIAPDDMLALAPHYREAGGFVDHARAAEVMAAAGWRALSVHAGEEAARYLSAAVDAARTPDRSTVELLEGLGRAYVSCGRLDDAVAAWHRGLGLAERLGDAESLTSLPHWLALVESERGEASRVAALTATPVRDAVSADAEHMLLRTIFLLRHGDDAALRVAAAELAAFADLDPAPAAQAAAHLGHELSSTLDNDFAAALASAKVALSYGVQCVRAAPMLGTWANRDLIGLTVLAGDIPAALTHTRHFFDTFGASVTPPTRCNARYTLALVHYLLGDLDTALDEIDTGIALARRVAMPRALGRTLACRAFLLAEQGRLAEARACLAEARANHTADEVSLIAVEELTETSLALQSGSAPPPLTSRALYEEPIVMSLRIAFAGLADPPSVIGYLRELGRTAPLLKALADRLEGFHGKDSELLRSAGGRLTGMGAIVLGAQASLEWAELSGDRETVARCLSVFERAGVSFWVDRTRRLARSLGVRVPVSRKSGELSKRESQIVGLVGEGLSNADIAARLFLSERTVETHLRNAYARLGLGSRVALTRWAVESGRGV